MSPKRASNSSSPVKAKRTRAVIDRDREAIWTSERLIHAKHFSERAADSGTLLSTRTSREVVLLSLREISLRKAVEGFQNVLKITKWDSAEWTEGSAVGTSRTMSSGVGWSRDRSQEQEFMQEIADLSESISLLPPNLFNCLLHLLLLRHPIHQCRFYSSASSSSSPAVSPPSPPPAHSRLPSLPRSSPAPVISLHSPSLRTVVLFATGTPPVSSVPARTHCRASTFEVASMWGMERLSSSRKSARKD